MTQLLPASLAAVMVLSATSTVAARPEKPNILFVMIDDLGPEWVSSYGAEDIKTPRMDALAETGLSFQAASVRSDPATTVGQEVRTSRETETRQPPRHE